MENITIFQKTEDFFDKENLNIIFNLKGVDRARLIGKLTLEARKHGVEEEFRSLVREAAKQESFIEGEKNKNEYRINNDFYCELDSKGKPKKTIENLYNILTFDTHFEAIRFNEMSGRAETFSDKGTAIWTNTDNAEAKKYIESKYGIHDTDRYDNAFRLLLKDRAYNPIKEKLAFINWDGKSRICHFLHKCMRAEDTPYTREVSRLIFAGGIHRLYEPGCKFDEMPVLIGTRQGEGKSTIVRWLAMDDRYFNEVTVFDDKKGAEAVGGMWICEVSELLALTKTKDVEAVKSFITRTNDYRRVPYDKLPEDHQRQCIFIGTTNKEQFLIDKTGNRRFYPVKVWQWGYNLYENEKAIKAYIEQCWAEALYLYGRGELKPYADPDMVELIRQKQLYAVQDDYREGMIRDFLETKEEVCIPMLWYEALKMRSDIKPTRKDSNEISLIMQNCEGWVRQEKVKKFKDYGTQQCWKKEFIPL